MAISNPYLCWQCDDSTKFVPKLVIKFKDRVMDVRDDFFRKRSERGKAPSFLERINALAGIFAVDCFKLIKGRGIQEVKDLPSVSRGQLNGYAFFPMGDKKVVGDFNAAAAGHYNYCSRYNL
ncbi:MAG: hypothetical protein KKF56_00315 [Nanoarchaeota archaeon]|nr:hypothetical protein [Nanoarchaeota archaeon]